MIAAAELMLDYRLVHGDPKNITGRMARADLHLHEAGDTTDTPTRIVRAAIRRGLDLIAVTNHDDPDGYERASKIRDRLSMRRGDTPRLTVLRAAEVTAANNQHVLVYNLKSRISIGLSLPKLLEEVDRQGSIASMAHPELEGISPRKKDIEGLLGADNPTFALEVHNGGAALIDLTRDFRLPGFIRRRIPAAGSNEEAKTIFDTFKDKFLGATGGSDAHNARHVGDVVTCYPSDMDVFDAIRNGKSVVMERRRLPRATATNLVVGTVRGLILEGKRRTGKLQGSGLETAHSH